MMKEIKTSTGVLFILAFAAVVFGGLYTYANVYMPVPDYSFSNYIQNPSVAKVDATKDWKTYTNASNGFSAKYPKDWFADTSSSDSIVIFSNHDKASQYDVSNSPADLMKFYVREYTTNMQAADQKNLISQKTSGDIAVLSLRNPEAGASSSVVYNKVGKFTVGGKTLEMGMSTGLPTASMAKELSYFDQIVSTFKLTTPDPTADWQTYTKDSNGIGFKYPEAWGVASLDDGTKAKVETGHSYNIAFSKNQNISMGYTSTDMSAGREGTLYEMININKDVLKINNCATYKQYMGNQYATSCKDVEKNNKTIGMIIVIDYPEDGMTPGPFTVGYFFTGNNRFPLVGVSTDNKATATSEMFESIIKSFL